jgi:predicted histidine transporter YuiF (NhaC family)
VAVLLLGMVFLMTTKPDLGGSLIVMAVALVLGLLSSFLVSRRRRPSQQEQEVANQSVQEHVSAG